jgi:predicted MPP superfamily phosphohydrolase
VKDLHHGGKDYHSREKAEKEIEDYLTSLGFKEKHKGFVFGLLNFKRNEMNSEKIVKMRKKRGRHSDGL